MRQWPWITLAVAAIAAVTPIGQNVIYLSFFSGEQLSNDIWRPFFFIGLTIVFVIAALEWWIRRRIHRRRVEY
jgi:membrane protein DedA with SNARE-associated domain